MVVSFFQNQTQLLVLDKFSVFTGYEGLLSKGMLPTLGLSPYDQEKNIDILHYKKNRDQIW